MLYATVTPLYTISIAFFPGNSDLKARPYFSFLDIPQI